MEDKIEIKSIDFSFVFARFCYFYHVSDEHVMQMPVRRFWSMEGNISRIMAERDLRAIYVQSASNSQDNYSTVTERLTTELGKAAEIKHKKIVKPEPGAKDKFKHLTGG